MSKIKRRNRFQGLYKLSFPWSFKPVLSLPTPGSEGSKDAAKSRVSTSLRKPEGLCGRHGSFRSGTDTHTCLSRD